MSLYELSVVQMLEQYVNPAFGYEEEETFWELIRHPDMNRIDPVTGQLQKEAASTAALLLEIHYRNHSHSDVLPRLIDMPFLETFDKLDYIPLKFLEYMLHGPADVDPEDQYWVLSHPSWQKGLTDEEPLLPLMMYLERKDPALAAQVASLPWVEDGIDDSEKYPALRLQALPLESVSVFRAVMNKPWIQDGLNRAERSVLYSLRELSGGQWFRDSSMYEYFSSEAMEMLQMPFLESVEPFDARALWALVYLMDHNNSRPTRVLRQPVLQAGITDKHTAAILAAVFLKFAPSHMKNNLDDLLYVLLDPGQTTLEERTFTLPLAGDVQLMVLSADNYPYYMHYLEQAVRQHEEFMGVPFPYDSGVLVITEIGGGGWASWYRGGITIDVGYAKAGNNEVRGTVAHEVAHAYWPSAVPWLAEGPAVFMERISRGMYTHESNFKIGTDTCASSYNIADHP